MPEAEIGIIGGSGLYQMPGLTQTRELKQDTPFGDPSDQYILGTLEGRKVAFLSRHGRGHRIMPSELNFRANIYGFKQLGVERILSLSAVGSLKEEHKPLEFVIPDQFYDHTRRRVSTFFGEGKRLDGGGYIRDSTSAIGRPGRLEPAREAGDHRDAGAADPGEQGAGLRDAEPSHHRRQPQPKSYQRDENDAERDEQDQVAVWKILAAGKRAVIVVSTSRRSAAPRAVMAGRMPVGRKSRIIVATRSTTSALIPVT